MKWIRETDSIAGVLPPWTLEPGHRWIRVGQFAHEWNKNRNTIRQWCESGYLCTLGISTYRDPKGRWFIRIA